MGEHKLPKAKKLERTKDIEKDTATMAEVGAYQAWQEVMDLAYKKDGMVAVVITAAAILEQANYVAALASDASPGCENIQRATIAFHLQTEFLPSMVDELKKTPDGPHYWELADGGTTDFPEPGQCLQTAAATRAIMKKCLAGFEEYRVMKEAGVTPLPSFFQGMMTA